MALPQKLESTLATLIGHRHLRGARFNSEQGSALTTSSAMGAATKSALSMSRWVRTGGLRIDTLLCDPGAARLLPRDSPSRLILPMTAFRETPISPAICAQVRPALKPLLSCSMRSVVHVSRGFLMDVSVKVIFGLVTSWRGQLGRGQGEVELTPPRLERMADLRLTARTDAIKHAEQKASGRIALPDCEPVILIVEGRVTRKDTFFEFLVV